jgi:hypothetical protein
MFRGGSHAEVPAVDGPPDLLVYLGFAAAVPADARRAFGQALDRDAIRRFAANGPSTAVSTTGATAADAAQARAALAGTRFQQGALTLIIDRSRFEDEDVAQKVQAQLARAGVSVRLEALAGAEFERRVTQGRGFDLYVGLCTPPYLDAGGALPAAWTKRCGADDVPLFRRGLRAHHVPELRGLRFDATGRLHLEDAFLWRRPLVAGTAGGAPHP